jgi:hypothetical protein
MSKELSKTPPPYMSFGVFKSTIDRLADTTVPSGPLDRRVLHGLSGADYGSLMSGLRFLGFVDQDNKSTASYRELVQVSKDAQFKPFLIETLNAKYAPIIRDVDIQSGTITELEKAFKEFGVPAGQMLTKTIRFYVKALAECGVEISPHITKPKPRAPRNSIKPKVKPESGSGAAQNGGGVGVDANNGVSRADSIPNGFARMPVPGISEGFVQYPARLTDAQCEMYAAVVTLLRAYAKGIARGTEERK